MSFSVSDSEHSAESSGSEESYAKWIEDRRMARRALKASKKKTVTNSMPTLTNSMPTLTSDMEDVGVSNSTVGLDHKVESSRIF